MKQVKYHQIKRYISWLNLQIVPPHKLAYVEFGSEDKPVILCIHGLARNSRDFDKIATSLSENYRVICLDIAGRGKSEWFKLGKYYNYHVYVKDVINFLSDLKISKVHIIGTSMGGIIGMIIAAIKPKLVSSLILNDIGIHIPANSLNKIAKYVDKTHDFSSFDDAKKHFKLILANFGIDSEDDWNHITKHGIQLMTNGHYRMSYDPKILDYIKTSDKSSLNLIKKDIDLSRWWNKVTCPALVIRGEKSNILSEETVLSMIDIHNNTNYHLVTGAGHAPSLMKEEQISYISNWLKLLDHHR